MAPLWQVPHTRGQYFQTETATNRREFGHMSDAGQCALGPVRNPIPTSMLISKGNLPVQQEDSHGVPVGLGKEVGREDARGLSRPAISLRPVDLTTMGCLENQLSAFPAAPLKVNS